MNILIILYMTTATIYDICLKKIPLWLMTIFTTISIAIFLFSTEHSFNIFSLIPGIFMILLSILSRQALGMGDSIFILTLGLLLSISELICTILFSLFLASFFAIFLFIKRRNTKQSIPFVPFILISFLLLTLT